MADDRNRSEDVDRRITFEDSDADKESDQERLMRIANGVAGTASPSKQKRSDPSPESSPSGSPRRSVKSAARSPSPSPEPERQSSTHADRRNSNNDSRSPSPEAFSSNAPGVPRQSRSPTRPSERPSALANAEVRPTSSKTKTKKIHPLIRESYELLRDDILQREKNKSKMNPTVSRSVDMERHTSKNCSLAAEPSRVSRLISSREQARTAAENRMEFSSDEDRDGGKDDDSGRSRPRPIGPRGGLFRSEAEAVLFKTMKTIRPKSASGESGSGSTSTRSCGGGPRGLSQGSLASMGTVQTTGTRGSARSGFSASRCGSMTTQNYKSMTASIDRLTGSTRGAKPTARPKHVYASYDEMKNCTFKPKIRRRAADRGNDSSGDEGETKSKAASSKAAFVDRQAQDERKRRSAVEHRRGKEAYDAIVDKKFCPRCTAKRSYDEYREKKKRCSNCNVEFTSKVVWTQRMGTEFFKRDHEFIKLKDDHVEKLRDKVIEDLTSYEGRTYDEETGRLVSTRQNLFSNSLRWDSETKAEFEERLEACNQKKEERFEKILAEMSYSFAPALTQRKKRGDDEDEEEEEEDGGKRNVVRHFMERMERDTEKYRQSHPAVPKVVKTDPFPRFA